MRSSVVVALCSMLALGALAALGLDVPEEPMQRGADPVVSVSETAVPETAVPETAVPETAVPETAVPVTANSIGPEHAVASGPPAPSVPALTLRSSSPSASPETRVHPVRLRMPALGMDASIVDAGVDADGAFDVPGPDLVGWYVHGPLPGDEGAAVLAAHVDLDHRPGVFYHLDDVLLGDRLHIDFLDGATLTFEVVDEVLYDKTALPEAELFRRSGEPVLHLVTCGGVFDPEQHHYLGNRVVTARLID